MKLPFLHRRRNSLLSCLALDAERVGQMLHHLEERLQAAEQALADHRREFDHALAESDDKAQLPPVIQEMMARAGARREGRAVK